MERSTLIRIAEKSRDYLRPLRRQLFALGYSVGSMALTVACQTAPDYNNYVHESPSSNLTHELNEARERADQPLPTTLSPTPTLIPIPTLGPSSLRGENPGRRRNLVDGSRNSR